MQPKISIYEDAPLCNVMTALNAETRTSCYIIILSGMVDRDRGRKRNRDRDRDRDKDLSDLALLASSVFETLWKTVLSDTRERPTSLCCDKFK